MLEMKTEGGVIRLLYNADGPVERIAIGESSPGECPPLISKVPVGLGDAAQEIATLAGVPNRAILDALTTSQPPERPRGRLAVPHLLPMRPHRTPPDPTVGHREGARIRRGLRPL